MSERALVACYGGTFDPPHLGHLEAARDVLERTGADSVHLMPCHVPPHRGLPRASARQRLQMTRLAVQDIRGLVADGRELERAGPSYTVDTLEALRQELGGELALGWVIGSDALIGLPAWSRWQRLPELAHLLVLDRPGVSLPDTGPVAELLRERHADTAAALHSAPAGRVFHVRQRPLAVSSSEVRQRIDQGLSVEHLLPTRVWAYIKEERLYGTCNGHNAESE